MGQVLTVQISIPKFRSPAPKKTPGGHISHRQSEDSGGIHRRGPEQNTEVQIKAGGSGMNHIVWTTNLHAFLRNTQQHYISQCSLQLSLTKPMWL